MTQLKIFLVESDSTIPEDSVRSILERLELGICGAATISGTPRAAETSAVRSLALGDSGDIFAAIQAASPDLVVVDCSSQEDQALRLTRQIKARNEALPVLILSEHEQSSFAERAFQAGALGYLAKRDSDKLSQAICKLRAGELYLSEKLSRALLRRLMTGQLIGEKQPFDCLSQREFQVFRLVGECRSTQQIAEELSRSVKTIESHRAAIKRKLGLRNGRELVQQAIIWELENRE